MNRRTFLRRFTTGVVATAALAHIPASVVKMVGLDEAAERYALKHLTKLYNDHYKAHKRVPREFEVGKEFFEAMESEIVANMRFSASDEFARRNLAFKTAKVVAGGNGWYARVVA
jgi:hypothetical protein